MSEKEWPLVHEHDDGIRPAGAPDECLYCRQKVGQPHGSECVVVTKKVKVRAIIEYEVQQPFSWDKRMIEFHLNESSVCADNALNDMLAFAEADGNGCLCFHSKFEVLEQGDVPERKLRQPAPDPSSN